MDILVKIHRSFMTSSDIKLFFLMERNVHTKNCCDCFDIDVGLGSCVHEFWW